MSDYGEGVELRTWPVGLERPSDQPSPSVHAGLEPVYMSASELAAYRLWKETLGMQVGAGSGGGTGGVGGQPMQQPAQQQQQPTMQQSMQQPSNG